MRRDRPLTTLSLRRDFRLPTKIGDFLSAPSSRLGAVVCQTKCTKVQQTTQVRIHVVQISPVICATYALRPWISNPSPGVLLWYPRKFAVHFAMNFWLMSCTHACVAIGHANQDGMCAGQNLCTLPDRPPHTGGQDRRKKKKGEIETH